MKAAAFADQRFEYGDRTTIGSVPERDACFRGIGRFRLLDDGLGQGVADTKAVRGLLFFIERVPPQWRLDARRQGLQAKHKTPEVKISKSLKGE